MSRSKQYRNGLIHYEPDFAHRGYTLFCGGSPGSAFLIDMQGRICKRWQHPEGIAYANLLANGNLLCRGRSAPQVGGMRGLASQCPVVFELDWDGHVVWEYRDDWMHHDHERLPNGNTLVIAWRWLPKSIGKKVRGGIAHADDPAQLLADVLLEIDPNGKVVREWESWKHLDVEKDVICPLDHRLEWTHANSVYLAPNGDWIISFRRTHTVVAVDPESGAIRWRWGPGITFHQHDARILPNGRLLVFDNGVHRTHDADYSRVLEVDLEKNDIVWRYQDEPAFHFYSFMAGSAERLVNNNTLICHASVGRFFEVTHSGEIVWEYVNPFYATNPRLGGAINITFRAHRYGLDDSALAGRDLDPAAYATLNRAYASA